MEPQSGRTTAQMKAAAPNAYFVWCNGFLAYPADLAKALGRFDLLIVSPHWAFENEAMRLKGVGASVIVDHAFIPDTTTAHGFEAVIERQTTEAV